MLMPTVVYLGALVGFPLVLAVMYAFTDATTGNPSLHLVGLQSFKAAIDDPVFLTALRNTFVITFTSQLLVLVFGTVLAFVLSTSFRGKWIVRFLILLPWAAPIALGAVAWLWLLDSIYSPIDWILRAVGLLHHGGHMDWLGRSGLAIGSVAAVQTWRMLPLATVIIMAGLSAIPQDLKDAAEMDGAGTWRKLFHVTLPLLAPVGMVALLFGIVFSFTDMAVVSILTQGGPDNATQVLASWAFYRGINGGALGEGAAVAVFMFPVLVGLAAVLLRVAARAEVG